MENINTRKSIQLSSSDKIGNVLPKQDGIGKIALVAVTSSKPRVDRNSRLITQIRDKLAIRGKVKLGQSATDGKD